jgi:serine/threonine-protein kinase
MEIRAGQQLLHYRLKDKLGEGGMGVVWRATDTTLDREVAIKILPEAFALDTERLARFEREAKLLASLNHPNIASVYGLHRHDGLHFLSMELVEGEDLSTRLVHGALPVEDALSVALQVSEALEAAHEQGVIHRDLKPANVRLTPDGKAKVLDFGLAKALSSEPGLSSGDPSRSPTITSTGTLAGVILGTASYMSPEQAKGYGVDRRADIWALGVILYEMLIGRQVFSGETVSETLASVLKDEVDESALPDETPTKLKQLLRRCLRRDPKRRLRDVGDARLEIEEILAEREWTKPAGSDEPAGPAPRRSYALAGLLLLVGVLLGTVVTIAVLGDRTPSTRGVNRVSVIRAAATGALSLLSPDGTALAYPGDESGVYLRRFDDFEETLVRGTEGPVNGLQFSPDGQWLAFVRDGTPARLFKVPVDGSAPPVEIATLPPAIFGLLWTARDEIVTVSGTPFSLWKISASGGGEVSVVPITEGIAENQLVATGALPDGGHVLALADAYGGTDWQTNVVAIDVDSGDARVLVEDGFFAQWSPTGHLVFTRGDTLHAVAFDEVKLATTGGPVALIEGIRGGLVPGGFFSLSADGTLAYRAGGERGRDRLGLLDAEGNVTPWSEDRHDLFGFGVTSQDGSMLATSTLNLDEGLNEIWISGVDRPRLQPFADEPATDCVSPVLSSDGEEIFFACYSAGGAGGVFRRRTDGSTAAQSLMERDAAGSYVAPCSVSPDGRWLLVVRFGQDRDDAGLYRLDLSAGDGVTPESFELDATGIDLNLPSGVYFSPDGRWVATRRVVADAPRSTCVASMTTARSGPRFRSRPTAEACPAGVEAYPAV